MKFNQITFHIIIYYLEFHILLRTHIYSTLFMTLSKFIPHPFILNFEVP